MRKQQILLIEPRITSQSAVAKMLSNYDVDVVHDADSAVLHAVNKKPDLVIMEMSLSGHSGMEFLYEFRTYTDWENVPIIIYSSLKINDEILFSRAWEKLNVFDYIYKPESTMSNLKSAVEKALG